MTESRQAVAGMGDLVEQEHVPACRACGQPRLTPVLDLGEQHLPQPDGEVVTHPVRVVFCRGCGLLQQPHPAPRGKVYHARYGYRSGDDPEVCRNLEQTVFLGLSYKPTVGRWLDIGCNDGTLLGKVPARVYRVGVDPVAQPAVPFEGRADEYIADWFEPARFTHPDIPALLDTRFDVITSMGVFDTVADPGRFVDDVRSVLAPNGVWVLQQPYAGSLVERAAVDLITPERVAVWSMLALVPFLAAHGLRVLDATVNPLHGGSLRLVVTHDRSWLFTQPSVAALLKTERDTKLGRLATFKAFAAAAQSQVLQLGMLGAQVAAAGQLCMLYEPSERAGLLLQAAGLGAQQISGAVTRNPRLVGTQFEPAGVRWLSLDSALRLDPEFMIVGPWWSEPQVVERERHYLATGGRLVFPLPVLHVVSRGGRSVTVREDR